MDMDAVEAWESDEEERNSHSRRRLLPAFQKLAPAFEVCPVSFLFAFLTVDAYAWRSMLNSMKGSHRTPFGS